MTSNLAQIFFMIFRRKNGCSSKSVCSIDSGPIFQPRLYQELSRNAFVVSILSFQKKLSARKDFFMTPKNRDFHQISSFLEMTRRAFSALSVIPRQGHMTSNLAQIFFMIFRHKNGCSSKSVCSIDSGPIFPPRLSQELSRNAFTVSILSFQKSCQHGKIFL